VQQTAGDRLQASHSCIVPPPRGAFAGGCRRFATGFGISNRKVLRARIKRVGVAHRRQNAFPFIFRGLAEQPGEIFS